MRRPRPGPRPTRPSRRAAELGGVRGVRATWRWLRGPGRRGCCGGARSATEAARQRRVSCAAARRLQRIFNAEAALAGGDLVAARRWADDAVSTTTGGWLVGALTARARVAIAQGEPDRLSVTPTTRSRVPPKSRRTCSSQTFWNASALWPARPAVTAKPPAFSARQRPSGSAWARSASRSVTPATRPR